MIIAQRQAVVAAPRKKREPLFRGWGRLELFVLILYVSSGLLLLPGTQVLRAPIRALPYVASLALYFLYANRSAVAKSPPGGRLAVLAMLTLGVSLFHPSTLVPAGIAQIVLQLSIVAPLFWAANAVLTKDDLRRLLWLILAVNAVGALVGVLQVFLPQWFMPPSLSVDSAVLAQMTVTGFGGRQIIRPPGLSDLPGGAAIAGMVATLFGCAFGVEAGRSALTRLACLAVALLGLVVMFLTSSRAVLLMAVLALLLLLAMMLRQGRVRESSWIALVGTGAVAGTFAVAGFIGGRGVIDRFTVLLDAGLVGAYQTNRGQFLAETFNDLMYRYPLGAGLGRWGMMRAYFGDLSSLSSPPIWVEIQLTGWLVDGGLLMWVFYGGALLAAMAYSYRTAVRHPVPEIARYAAIVLCVQFVVAGTAMSGPAFNTTLGTQFWMLTAALYGVATREGRRPATPGAVRGSPAPTPLIRA